MEKEIIETPTLEAYVLVATNEYHLRGFMAIVAALKDVGTSRQIRMLVTPQVPGWFRDIFTFLGVFVVGKLAWYCLSWLLFYQISLIPRTQLHLDQTSHGGMIL